MPAESGQVWGPNSLQTGEPSAATPPHARLAPQGLQTLRGLNTGGITVSLAEQDGPRALGVASRTYVLMGGRCQRLPKIPYLR